MALKDLFKGKTQPPEVTPAPMIVTPEEKQQAEPAAEKKKKRTNPQNDNQRKRSSQVKIRLTEEEVAALKAAAAEADMSMADFIMASVKRSPVVVIEDVPKMLLELRRQGSNLNQMVRLAHQTHSADLPELREAVHHCVATQAEIVRFCDTWHAKLVNKIRKGE